MAIRATCESCEHSFITQRRPGTTRVRCPECGEAVTIGTVRKGKATISLTDHPAVLIGSVAGGTAIAVILVIGAMLQNAGAVATNDAPPLSNARQTTVASTVTLPPAAPAGSSPAVATPTLNTTPALNSGASPTTAVPSSSPIAAVATTNPAVPPTIVPQSSAPGVTSVVGGVLANVATAPAAVAGMAPAAVAPGTRAPDLPLVDLIERCEPSVVRIDVETNEGKGCGSGFVVDKSGIIITNYHVIAGARRAVCAFRDGSQATVEGFLMVDPLRDVAILKVNHPADKLFPIKLSASHPRKGEKVVAFGAPLGLSWTATEGIISAFRTKAELAQLGIDGIEGDWIQTSTPISPGNSGGPLVTFAGELVGMNTMQLTIGQNLNFAVQSKEIELVLKQSVNAKLVALAPETLPTACKTRTPKLVDVTKDERGRKALGRLKEVTLLLAMSRDPSGRIEAIVRKKAVDTAKQLGLLVRDGDETDNELMLVTMHFEENLASKNTAFEVHVSAVVFMRDRNEKGQMEILKVWEKEEKLGSVGARHFVSGELPRTLIEKLGSFFGKFKGSFFTAHREIEKAEKAKVAAGENDKTRIR